MKTAELASAMGAILELEKNQGIREEIFKRLEITSNKVGDAQTKLKAERNTVSNITIQRLRRSPHEGSQRVLNLLINDI